jgi:uncharacterized PurR-regulated membrane protein YhhQ (DUF165 family)
VIPVRQSYPKRVGAIAGYVGAIVAANWLTAHYGLVPVLPGLLVTAGTYAAGAALLLRDVAQDAAGRVAVLAAIVVGGAMSWVMASPPLATASVAAFLIAELADMALYTPLRRRGWARAVVASNTVGALLDTLVFLWLAGFGLTVTSVAGQLVGKVIWATLIPVLIVDGVLRRRAARAAAESVLRWRDGGTPAVLYLATPSTPRVREAMTAGLIGCMTTPKQGNRVPDGASYACDNGKFGKGWPGVEAWRAWLVKTVERYSADRCLWAVAPDVPFDAAGTLRESLPELAFIRRHGVPAAFCAQNGSEAPGMVPWDAIDVLFLAGDTAWKLSRAAADLADEARARGKSVHMGRVNSERRLRHAMAIGCATADGTFLAFGPDQNLPKLAGWLARMPRRQPPHVGFPMFDLEPEPPARSTTDV